MSTPFIREGHSAAIALSKFFRKSFDELDAADGEKDGGISLGAANNNYSGLMANSDFASKIAHPLSMHMLMGGICENIFVIDNGDGKIGEGDLLLHADGYYQEKGKVSSGFLGVFPAYSLDFAFRVAPLFSPRFQKVSGYEAAESDDMSANVEPIINAFKREILRDRFSPERLEFSKAVTYGLNNVCLRGD